MGSIEVVGAETKRLYAASSDDFLRGWFYQNHVLVVATYASQVAESAGAQKDVCVAAALLHDVARAWGVMDEPALMDESLKKARAVLAAAGCTKPDTEAVIQAIVHHSCRDGRPQTEEGKVVATADAMAHLMTDFYLALPLYARRSGLEDYKKWARKKIERDFHDKIFYPVWLERARNRYEALCIVFGGV